MYIYVYLSFILEKIYLQIKIIYYCFKLFQPQTNALVIMILTVHLAHQDQKGCQVWMERMEKMEK